MLGSGSFRYNTNMLFNLLRGQPLDASLTIVPSYFLNEMMISYEERLKRMSKFQFKKESFFPHYITSKYFKVTPRFVVVQSFDVGKPYVIQLEIQSKARVLKSLKISSENTRNFSVVCVSKIICKVAPGMMVKFNVNFFPNADCDYFYEICFETEDETFIVPVVALSSRPLLDFPDHVDFECTPVKILKSKVLFVKNIGKILANFSLSTQGPFSVEPLKGILAVGDSIQMTLKLFSSCIGDYSGSLVIAYEHGEELTMSLKGSVINASISIDKEHLVYPLTYMTLQEKISVTITNDSDHVINFHWQKNPDVETDMVQIMKLKKSFKLMKDLETMKCNQLEYHDIIDKDNNAQIYDRIYENHIINLSDEDFEFSSPDFSIIPIKGELWPHNSTEITVLFSPLKPKDYKCQAYCELTGLDRRLPLQMEGAAIGPDIKLNINSLNISSVSLCSEQTFEILVKNFGDIPGEIKYIFTEANFGGRVLCSPESNYLLPDETKVFFILFSSTMRGEFIEEIHFQIVESEKDILFLLLGKVLCPTIYFDKDIIDFGEVPLGFPVDAEVPLVNASLVPVSYCLFVLNDGYQRAITCNDFAKQNRKGSLPFHPKEFIITPAEGIISAGECINIQITFIPNSYRTFVTSLILDLVDTQQETIMLTVSGSAIFPTVLVSPRSIHLPFCFINYRYVEKFVIENKSYAPGYYYIVPQESHDSPLTYKFSVNEGFINANEIIKIELEIFVNELGEHKEQIKMLLFGEQKPHSVLSLVCTGQGPVVTVTPNVLNYGQVQLLETHSLRLSMINDAPIPAAFTAVFDERFNYSVNISPDHGILLSNEKCSLLVTLRMCDSGPISDNLIIKVKESRAIVINIFAKGVGTGIVVEPKIYPVFCLGKLASKKHYTITLKVTNYSSKLHTLYWTRDQKCRSQVLQSENINWKYFKFDPNKLDVFPQQSTKTTLHIFSTSDKEVSEFFYNFAVISNRGSRFILDTCSLKATFISPGIDLSEPNLYFRIDVLPEKPSIVPQTKTVVICNKTDCPANTTLRSNSPFYVLDAYREKTREVYLNLDENSESTVSIMFDPGVTKNLNSVVYSGALKFFFRDTQDEILLTGEVNFPNIHVSLNEFSFGSVPCGSGVTTTFSFSNTGVLSASYYWNVYMKCIPLHFPVKAGVKYLYSKALGTTTHFYYHKNGIRVCCDSEQEAYYVAPFSNRDYVVQKYMICGDPCVVRDKLQGILYDYLSEILLMKIDGDVLTKLPSTRTEFCQVLDILPSYGVLDGRRNEFAAIGFWPAPATAYKIMAYCHVSGGPMQILSISGSSSRLRFSLDKTEINFGYSTFCDTHSRSVTLKNHGDIALNFVVEIQNDTADLPTMLVRTSSTIIENSAVNSGLFFVEPVSGIVEPNCSTTLNVTYYPSVSLELDSSFIIQVNHMNPIVIKVKGYGVMPQVSINLPHSLSPRIPVKLMYFAVAQLTSSFFSFPEKPNHSDSTASITFILPVTSQPKDIEDWVFVTFEDVFPSIIDIDLCIERALVYSYSNEDPSNVVHSLGLKTKAIQGILAPEYVLDFGYVVVETVVQQTMIIRNGGLCPMPQVSIVLPYQKKVMNTKNDLNLEYRQASGSEDIVLFAALSPKIANFQSKIQNLNFIFHAEVYGGLRIPIRLIGVITMPYLSVCSRMLNFKDVLCGEKKTIPILLKNEGYVPCCWTVAMKPHMRTVSFRSSYSFSPFSTNVGEGHLEPEDFQVVEVYFQPDAKGKYDDHLVVSLELNPDPIRIHVLGYGTEPSIEISETSLRFDTSCPYPQNLSKHFTVFNSGKTPVEIYLPDFDGLLVEEEAALRTLCLLYDTDELLLGKDEFSTSLSPKVIDFYRDLIKMVKADIEDDTVASSSFTLSSSVIEDKSMSKTVSSQELSKTDLPNADFELVYDYIAANRDKYIDLLVATDPLKLFDQESARRLVIVDENELHRELIIFYGAPSTDYVIWANKAAANLSFVATNIDQMIFEELIESRSQSAVHVRQFIEEAYFNLLVEMPETQDESIKNDPDADDDPYYELIRKFRALLEYKAKAVELQQSQGKSKNAGRRTSQAAKAAKATATQPGSKKGKNVTKGEYNYAALLLADSLTFMNLPIDNFKDILQERLKKIPNGLVIESLNSLFIYDIMKTLTLLLSVRTDYQTIHFVILYDSLELFLKRCIEERAKSEERKRQFNHKRIIELDNMSADEFDKQDKESQKLFRDEVLAKRRQRFAEHHSPKITPVSPKSVKPGSNKSKSKKDSGKKSNKESSHGEMFTKLQIPDFMKDDLEQMKKILKFEGFHTELIIIKHILEFWDPLNTTQAFVDELLKNAYVRAGAGTQMKKGKPPTKSTAEPKVASVPTSSRLSAKLDTNTKDKGIYTWIFNHRKDYLQYITNLRKMLMVDRAHHSVHKEDITCSISNMLCNSLPPTLTLAVKKPQPRKSRSHNREFSVTSYGLEPSPSENSSSVISSKDRHDTKTGKSLIRDKKSSKKSMSKLSDANNFKIKMLENNSKSGDDSKTLITRILLKPNDLYTWFVSFLPQIPGNYEDEFLIEVARGKKQYVVKCSGVCDIPCIDKDPCTIFPQVLDSVPGSTVSELVYIKKTEKFYFGPVMAKKERNESDLGVEANFKFCNVSELSIDMKIDFYVTDDDINDAFDFEPKTLKIDVNSCKKITVWAKPKFAGTHVATLVYSIKNNPEPGLIKISCVGVKPDFKIEPRILSFERVLLHRKDTKVVLLVNDCYLPLKWVFVSAMTFDPDITILPPSGIIEPLATKEVYFEYLSSCVQNTKKTVDLEVYDVTGLQELLFSEQLQVKIESYDVLIDVIFLDSDYKYINFDKIKVDEIVNKTLSLKNKGNYSVLFSIELEKISGLSFDPKEIFAIDPQQGNLGPNGKSLNIEVMCLCTNEVSLKESPIIRITITDTLSKDALVAVIPVGVSVRSYFSSYEIAPQFDINFGPMHVSSKKELHIHIANTGLFNFNYKFVNSSVPINDSVGPTLPKTSLLEAGKKGKKSPNEKVQDTKSAKSTATGKKKEKVPPVKPLQMGPFLIPKPVGLLTPGASVDVVVECNTPTLGEITEDIRICISESRIKGGIPMKLLAHGCLPQINFSDLEFIFQDATLRDTSHNFRANEKVKEPKAFFDKDDNTLIFYNTIVGSTAKLDLHLHNSELLATDVSSTVTCSNSCFSVFPDLEMICPHSTKCITVSFSPIDLEVVEALLEISAGDNKSLTLNLRGEGIFPHVELLKPLNRNQETPRMIFLPTLLQSNSFQNLSFKNIGTITCLVILEVIGNEQKLFSLLPSDDTLHLINFYDEKVGTELTTLVNLPVDNTANFIVRFTPVSIGLCSCEIKLFVANNPYENLSVHVSGSGYMDDIICNELSRLTPEEFSELENNVELKDLFKENVTACFHIDFEYCYTSYPRSKSFKMYNYSPTSVYRYEWNEYPNYKIEPRSSFIYPTGFKDINITYVSHEKKVPEFIDYLVCNISKVEVVEESVHDLKGPAEEFLKHERAVTPISSIRSLTSVIEEHEFKHISVDGSWQKVLLRVSGTVDSAIPTTDVRKISFSDTLLFQSSSYFLDVKNEGYVPLIYEWKHKDIGIKYLEKPGLWKGNAASLVSVGIQRPRVLPALQIPPERPASAALPRRIGPRFRKLARPLSSSVLLLNKSHEFDPKIRMSNIEIDSGLSFSVSPLSGIIQPQSSEKFCFTFSPSRLCKYVATFSMKINQKPLEEFLKLEVEGTGIMPLCHLLFAESDCLATGAYRSATTLEPHTKVLEINVLGVGVPVTKRFDILNPTDQPYNFVWDKCGQNNLSQFKCNTITGGVEPRKQTEVSFSFLPNSAGVFDSLWKLRIPELHLIQPILLIGRACEPRVYFSCIHIHLKPTLIGEYSSCVPVVDYVNLINEEKINLEFKIDTTFLVGSDGDHHQITVTPMSGVIPAESELELKLDVTPKYGGEEMFLVKCAVTKCKTPLKLHVHISTYAVLPILIHEISSKQRNELHHSKVNRINLENMMPRMPVSLTFVLLNMGKPSFIYNWEENEEQLKRSKIELLFSKRSGIITSQSREYISINVTILSKITFKDILVSLKVTKGPQFNILLSGSGELPNYEFSFYEHNFGSSFVCSLEEIYHRTQLYVTNRDEESIIIETTFDNNEIFQVCIPENGIIKPRGQIEIQILFIPKEQKKYRDEITFVINGMFTQKITVFGHGHYLKMILAKSSDKLVNFGAVLVGQSVTKSIVLVNKCPAAGDVFLTTSPSENIPFTIEPSESELMKPNGSIKYYFTFSPTSLIKPFTTQVFLNCLDVTDPLCIVKGSCIGPNFCLDRDYIPFGCVILGCSSFVRFILLNTGDIGSKFAWDCNRPGSWITISPSSGYISPGSEIKFIVKFTPDCPVSYFRKEVSCNIDAFKPLKLVLTGSSILAPPPSETIQFSCPVRKSDQKSVTLFNPRGEVWTVYPVFKGEGFSGNQTLAIKSMKNATFEIVYAPLTMTTTSQHQGTLFFPFPNGTCKVYGLVGEASPPEAEDNIVWHIPAKGNISKLVTLINWLPLTQRFKMTTDVKSEESYHPIFTITGNKYTDVGPAQSRTYHFTVHSYREGKVGIKLYFTNEASEEYIWFNITAVVGPPLPLADIILKTRIRNSVKHSITLINPLTIPVTFKLSSSINEVVAEEPNKVIEGEKKGEMVLVYTPLSIESKKSEQISITNEQLGDFPYTLHLTAEEPVPEKTVLITAEIGGKAVASLKVFNMSSSKDDFLCQLEHPNLVVTNKVSVEPGKIAEFTLSFEPTAEGTITKVLKVDSKTGGTFYFPVVAKGCKPKPSGPYIIKSGQTIDFNIKNVFNAPKKYRCFVDSPAFIVKNSELTIQPKKEAKVQVSMVPLQKESEDSDLPQFPVTGKLQVVLLNGASETSSQPKDVYCGQLTWTYYLRGIN